MLVLNERRIEVLPGDSGCHLQDELLDVSVDEARTALKTEAKRSMH